ncbi:MAG TPA: DUF1844 domain-containing protein [Phycisphaerae bacterium]|nr:DUF1844 domain-containing protein [Phycisphaerae bacterium]HNU46857.1 DUF1844 domain-containing protein [Phycisphaerae bacterium]
MSDVEEPLGFQIDDDWKSEAAREKKRLAEQERAAGGPDRPDTPTRADFLDLLNAIALQAAIGLGGAKGPSGEYIPPNPALARHHIDLLTVLEEKTKGNLTPEEARTLEAVLYEFRMQFVQRTMGAPAPPPEGGPGSAPQRPR